MTVLLVYQALSWRAQSECATEPATKAQRTNDLRCRLPYMRQSALAAILREAQRAPLPEVSSRTTIARAEADAVNITTPYEPLVKYIRISDSVEVGVSMPAPLLYHCATASPSVSALLKRTLSDHNPTVAQPLRVIVYLDEIVPGNELAHRNRRKTWGFYWSIMQWGPSVLCDEDTSHVCVFVQLQY